MNDVTADILDHREDMLAFLPAMIERLENVHGVKKVMQAKELKQLISKGLKPLDDAVYIVWDSFVPANDNNRSQEQIIGVYVSIILCKTDFNSTPALNSPSKTLVRIMRALQGWMPKSGCGNDLTVEPFRQERPLPIDYHDGFAFFPLRFSTEVVVLSGDDRCG